jgi:hypothetical protein
LKILLVRGSLKLGIYQRWLLLFAGQGILLFGLHKLPIEITNARHWTADVISTTRDIYTFGLVPIQLGIMSVDAKKQLKKRKLLLESVGKKNQTVILEAEFSAFDDLSLKEIEQASKLARSSQFEIGDVFTYLPKNCKIVKQTIEE